jgi:hypothetical protein
MSEFAPIKEFYEAIADDGRISVTHISLYMALLYEWNLNNFKNPICINRANIMKTAKISARQTYNTCMRQLHAYGYIQYFPSSNPLLGSLVHLKQLW